EVVHGHENTALRRLEPISDIGQSATHNHAHRVGEITPLELVLDRLSDLTSAQPVAIVTASPRADAARPTATRPAEGRSSVPRSRAGRKATRGSWSPDILGRIGRYSFRPTFTAPCFAGYLRIVWQFAAVRQVFRVLRLIRIGGQVRVLSQ